MSDFTCTKCEFTTAELKDGMSHAAETNHDLTRAVDEEGTTMTISVAWDEDIVDDYDEDDDWDEEDQW